MNTERGIAETSVDAFKSIPESVTNEREARAAARTSARGGGGRGATPNVTPVARLAAAVKAAPTLGYVWGSGVTGYSIKYAWRAPVTGRTERLVLVTDRRLDDPRPWRAGAGTGADDRRTRHAVGQATRVGKLSVMRVANMSDLSKEGDGTYSLVSNAAAVPATVSLWSNATP